MRIRIEVVSLKAINIEQLRSSKSSTIQEVITEVPEIVGVPHTLGGEGPTEVPKIVGVSHIIKRRGDT